MKTPHRLLMETPDEPRVRQENLNGWFLSWNPDDRRFYVGGSTGVAKATFRDWRNAVQWARTHDLGEAK